MTCSGGNRNGLLCLDTFDCDVGTCEPNDALCPSATCGGTVAGGNPITLAFPKNRFIGFIPPVDDTWIGHEVAVRITLSDINGFPECNGQLRWVGPPVKYCEGSELDCGPTFQASLLRDTPHWRDWTTVSGAIQVYGEEIVSSSRYSIQAIDKSNEDAIVEEANYSNGLLIDTSKWGDIITPLAAFSSADQPSLADVLSAVDKWLGNLNPIKVRSLMQPQVVLPELPISLSDILRVVDAWLGSPYPFSVPSCTP